MADSPLENSDSDSPIENLEEQISRIFLSSPNPSRRPTPSNLPPNNSSTPPFYPPHSNQHNPVNYLPNNSSVISDHIRHFSTVQNPSAPPFNTPHPNQHNPVNNLSNNHSYSHTGLGLDFSLGSDAGSSSFLQFFGPRNTPPPNLWDHLELARREELQFNQPPANYNPYYLANNNNNSNNLGIHGNGHQQYHHLADHIHVGQFNGHLLHNNQPPMVPAINADFRNSGYNINTNTNNNNIPVKYQPVLSGENSRGRIVTLLTNKSCSQLLLRKFTEGRMADLEKVVAAIKNNIVQVLCDKNGSDFFQNFLNFLDYQHIHQLFKAIFPNKVRVICFDYIGTKAAQAILEHVDKNCREIKDIILTATREAFRFANSSSYYFIDAVFSAFSEVHEVLQPLMRDTTINCMRIAMDKAGCRTLKHIIKIGEGPERNRLVNVVISHALELSEHDYGNYVVGLVATRVNEPHLNTLLVVRLEGHFVDLSMDKFGSHVIEQILKAASDEYAELIIREICDPTVFLNMCQHCFGNYVVQAALHKAMKMQVTSKSPTYGYLIDQIKAHYRFLHSHMYGKAVAKCV